MKGSASSPAPTKRFHIDENKQGRVLVDFLAEQTKYSKTLLKKIMDQGGVWIQKAKGKKRRVKRATAILELGDRIDFFYRDQMTIRTDGQRPLFERHHFGIWIKDEGIPSEPTPYADKGSLLYEVQKRYPKAHLVGRLDYEVKGLVLISYGPKVHALFDKIGPENFRKFYLVQVKGEIESDGEWTDALDKKAARTSFRVLEKRSGTTFLEVEIHSGRFHQIRRHFAMNGHPLMGDPRYGEDNKNKGQGLMLCAHRYILKDPMDPKSKKVEHRLSAAEITKGLEHLYGK